jgi:GGDEF domain-containing protein
MADIEQPSAVEPVGPDGGAGAGAQRRRRGHGDSDHHDHEDDGGGRGPGLSQVSMQGEVEVAPGLDQPTDPKVQALIDRLTARIEPLEAEVDALKAEADRLRTHAEHAEHLNVASEYGLRVGLGRVLSNRRHLSGVPGMVVVGVTGLEAVAAARGNAGWQRAVRTVLDVVRDAAHKTDTIGVLGSGQVAVVTLVGDHAALERLGRKIVDGIGALTFSEAKQHWRFGATFGGVELHDGATIDAAFKAADAARLAAAGPDDPVAVTVVGDASGAVAEAAAAEPDTAALDEAAALSDQDLDRVAILGTIDPGRVIHLPPEQEPHAEPKADSRPPASGPKASGDDVG